MTAADPAAAQHHDDTDPQTHPEPRSPPPPRRRVSTAASVTQSIASFTEDLVLKHDPAPGFLAATAQATSKAPTFGEIRKGSFGEEGWHSGKDGRSRVGSGGSKGSKGRSWSGSSGKKKGSRDSVKEAHGTGHGQGQLFAPLTEEPARISEDVRREASLHSSEEVEQRHEVVEEEEVTSYHDTKTARSRATDSLDTASTPEKSRDPAHSAAHLHRAHSSGYIPPPKLPWTQSSAIALKAFWRWFITPFGFLVTLYGLNVVAWGGMLFLLLCNASPAMCHAPVPTPENREKMPPAAALALPGPYYFNCNDINSPRRVWIEIDSQILNALFCVTGFGLVPWRFRDLYYLLRYRFASTKKQGLEGKMYGLRVLGGIHRGWFRLPGSETVDTMPSQDYLRRLEKENNAKSSLPPAAAVNLDLEASLSSTPTHDLRLPLPIDKRPADPVTSIRAPPTKVWLMDFFIWCQCWNTFFQCCLCGFMWGQDRYDRPPWSTGLFVALACIIAGVGGWVSFVQGRRVKRVEGVSPNGDSGLEGTGVELMDGGDAVIVRERGRSRRGSTRAGERVRDKSTDK